MISNQNEMARARSMRGLLYLLNQELGLHPSLNEAMRRILQLSMESVKAESGSLILLNECGEISHAVRVYAGKIKALPTDKMHAVVREGLANWVIENRQAALISNTRNDPRWLRQTWDDRPKAVRSAVCVPLIYANRVLGVLTLVKRQTAGFSSSDLALLSALAFCVSSTSIRAAMYPDPSGWQ
ncbi:MAG TPA: GAF domain-containing protein [Anaerolineales bacterium]|nr:GAF domain-containing protein [Anaerolineales bacterium]